MALYDDIIAVYPELTDEDFGLKGKGVIELRDDGNGIDYIHQWNYSKPLPEGLKVGK